ncbi:MAG: hypothetical protein AAGH15_08820 [Myxococcota bacterium]
MSPPSSRSEPPKPKEEAPAFAGLARRLAAVPDAALRIAYTSNALEAIAPEALASEVDVLLEGVRRAPEQATLLLSLAVALQDPRHAPLRHAAADVARDRGRSLTAGLLRPSGPETPENLPRPDFGMGRPLTLGERKTLARRRDRMLLLRVLQDPHPEVVRIVLGNPAVTEADIVRVAARRPAHPEALARIFRSPRWVLRYAVRLTLLQNPHCPADIAHACVALLRRSDAKKLARAPTLARSLRAACLRAARSPTLH